jgi:hypothetical protein
MSGMRGVFLACVLVACGGEGANPAVDGSSNSGADAASDAQPSAKRVFVSSLRYPANLKDAGGGADGLASADALCQGLADAVALGGTYRAWLSTTTVDAIDHVQGTGPWVRLDGAMAFLNHAALGTTPMVPISIDETHGMPDPFYEAWTGTGTGGRVKVQNGLASTTCDDWTSTVDSETIKGWLGIYGQADTTLGAGPEWTSYDDGYCSPFSRHLYCFEQ